MITVRWNQTKCVFSDWIGVIYIQPWGDKLELSLSTHPRKLTNVDDWCTGWSSTSLPLLYAGLMWATMLDLWTSFTMPNWPPSHHWLLHKCDAMIVYHQLSACIHNQLTALTSYLNLNLNLIWNTTKSILNWWQKTVFYSRKPRNLVPRWYRFQSQWV